jgi:hypothetical protein
MLPRAPEFSGLRSVEGSPERLGFSGASRGSLGAAGAPKSGGAYAASRARSGRATPEPYVPRRSGPGTAFAVPPRARGARRVPRERKARRVRRPRISAKDDSATCRRTGNLVLKLSRRDVYTTDATKGACHCRNEVSLPRARGFDDARLHMKRSRSGTRTAPTDAVAQFQAEVQRLATAAVRAIVE